MDDDFELFKAAHLGVGEYHYGTPEDDAWEARVNAQIEQVKAMHAALTTGLAAARAVRDEILAIDARLNTAEIVPTCDDYNQLYVVANCGLIDVLKRLGDTTDFGD